MKNLRQTSSPYQEKYLICRRLPCSPPLATTPLQLPSLCYHRWILYLHLALIHSDLQSRRHLCLTFRTSDYLHITTSLRHCASVKDEICFRVCSWKDGSRFRETTPYSIGNIRKTLGTGVTDGQTFFQPNPIWHHILVFSDISSFLPVCRNFKTNSINECQSEIWPEKALWTYNFQNQRKPQVLDVSLIFRKNFFLLGR